MARSAEGTRLVLDLAVVSETVLFELPEGVERLIAGSTREVWRRSDLWKRAMSGNTEKFYISRSIRKKLLSRLKQNNSR